jgi:hypothetical protein
MLLPLLQLLPTFRNNPTIINLTHAFVVVNLAAHEPVQTPVTFKFKGLMVDLGVGVCVVEPPAEGCYGCEK